MQTGSENGPGQPALSPIVDCHDPLFMSAVSTAEIISAGFHTMSHDLAPAMFTLRREGMNGTFKAVKITGDTGHYDLQGFIVFVSTNFAAAHKLTVGFSFQTFACGPYHLVLLGVFHTLFETGLLQLDSFSCSTIVSSRSKAIGDHANHQTTFKDWSSAVIPGAGGES